MADVIEFKGSADARLIGSHRRSVVTRLALQRIKRKLLARRYSVTPRGALPTS